MILAVLLMQVIQSSLFAQDSEKVTVFESGKEGYNSYRIPAIIQAENGDILAFAEGRVAGSADFGHVNIVMKRSTDKGKTWGKLTVVASNQKLQAGNPAPVLDQSDPKYPNGRLFLFYNTGNTDEGKMRHAMGIRGVWYKTSTDGGRSWSAAVDITDQTSKILRPAVNPAWRHPEDWRSYANTPGHGIQIEKGAYKGRIYIAANHSEGKPKRDYTDYVAHGFYTDDHGATFHLSDNNPIKGSNESTAAELSGGRLMMNSRNQKGDIRQRIVAISQNGGQHWDTAYFDPQLPDPVCEGSILTLKRGSHYNILAFSNDASQQSRDSMTLRISFDDGNTWRRSYLIASKATAYSDIVAIGKKHVGILYEADGYQKIIFTKINWKKRPKN